MLGRRVKVLAADVQTAHSEAGAAATEVLAGIRTVRAFSQEPAERSRYDRQMVRALEFARRKVQARALLGGVSLIAGEFAALLAIWVGGHLIVAGRMTTGALISFILYALLVARGFRNASRFTAEALRAIGATQWVFELLDRVPHIPLDGGDRPADLVASIALEPVRFRYPIAAGRRGAQGRRPAHRAGRGRRARRQVGIRQVDDAQPAASFLRSRPKGVSSSAGGMCAS